MMDGDPAQSIRPPIINSCLVLQGELEGGQHTNPPLPSGIEVWGGKDVHQVIVVSPDHKWRVREVLLEVFSDTPLEGKKLEFRAVVVFSDGIREQLPNVMGYSTHHPVSGTTQHPIPP